MDNVLQRICDPGFIGATIEAGVESGSKVVRKAAPDEKVGVMCLEGGRPSIVEYYELSDEMMEAKDEKGELGKPSEPNGYKFEQLVLDVIHMLDSCLPYEVEREKEFAPIKTGTGAVRYTETAFDIEPGRCAGDGRAHKGGTTGRGRLHGFGTSV